MKNPKLILTVLSFFLLVSFNSLAQEEVNKSFDAKSTLKVVTVSGDCNIEKSSNNKIEVHLTYTYSDDCFEYIINETADKLELKEKFQRHGRCKGMSKWTIRVPENIEVRFSSASGSFFLNGTKKGVKANTASGDIEVQFVEGDIDLSSASGDIEIEDSKGELDINTASGDIKVESFDGEMDLSTASGRIHIGNALQGLKASSASGDISAHNLAGDIKMSNASGDVTVENAKGSFDLSSASGDVDALSVEITDESDFSSASGDVGVVLLKSTDFDLTLSSASGNAVLDYNGNEIKGFFEFSARVDKGDIISPFAFDKEEVIEKHGKDYDVKSFTKGKASPKIILKTASGKAKLIK